MSQPYKCFHEVQLQCHRGDSLNRLQATVAALHTDPGRGKSHSHSRAGHRPTERHTVCTGLEADLMQELQLNLQGIVAGFLGAAPILGLLTGAECASCVRCGRHAVPLTTPDHLGACTV